MGYTELTQARITKLRQSMNQTNIGGGGVAVGNSAKSFDIKTTDGTIKMTVGGNGAIQSVRTTTAIGGNSSSGASSSDASNSVAKLDYDNIPIVTSVYYDETNHRLLANVGKLVVNNNTISVEDISTTVVFTASPHSGEI